MLKAIKRHGTLWTSIWINSVRFLYTENDENFLSTFHPIFKNLKVTEKNFIYLKKKNLRENPFNFYKNKKIYLEGGKT